jgi:hypothetical protein
VFEAKHGKEFRGKGEKVYGWVGSNLSPMPRKLSGGNAEQFMTNCKNCNKNSLPMVKNYSRDRGGARSQRTPETVEKPDNPSKIRESLIARIALTLALSRGEREQTLGRLPSPVGRRAGDEGDSGSVS